MIEIKKYNHPILRKKCEKVEEITEEIENLIEKMIKTVQKNQGVGLAACQIGLAERVIIIRTEQGYQEFINPEILWQSYEEEIMEEGCLSFPQMFLKIKRSKEVEIKALTKQGKDIHIKVQGILARIFQHEIDHLNGILFIDHVGIGRKIWELFKFYMRDKIINFQLRSTLKN